MGAPFWNREGWAQVKCTLSITGHGHYTAWVLAAPLPSGRPEPKQTPPSATLLHCLCPCTPCPLVSSTWPWAHGLRHPSGKKGKRYPPVTSIREETLLPRIHATWDFRRWTYLEIGSLQYNKDEVTLEWGGLKPNDWCLSKRGDTRRRSGRAETRQRPRDTAAARTPGPPQLERHKGPSPGASRWSAALPHLDLGVVASRQ